MTVNAKDHFKALRLAGLAIVATFAATAVGMYLTAWEHPTATQVGTTTPGCESFEGPRTCHSRLAALGCSYLPAEQRDFCRFVVANAARHLAPAASETVQDADALLREVRPLVPVVAPTPSAFGSIPIWVDIPKTDEDRSVELALLYGGVVDFSNKNDEDGLMAIALRRKAQQEEQLASLPSDDGR